MVLTVDSLILYVWELTLHPRKTLIERRVRRRAMLRAALAVAVSRVLPANEE